MTEGKTGHLRKGEHEITIPLSVIRGLRLSGPDTMESVNGYAAFMSEVKQLKHLGNSGFPGHELVEKQTEVYREVNKKLYDEVNSVEATQTLREIATRYQNTAELPLPSFLDRVRKGNHRTLIFDFDNTVSDFKKYRPGLADPLLPGSEALDPILEKNRGHALSVFASLWVPVSTKFSEVFKEGGKAVPFREGMDPLLEYLVEQDDVDVKIVSNNFAPFLESALSRIKGSNKIEVFCLREDDARAVEKGDVIKMLQLRNPNSVVEYVGDGSSDLPTLQAAKIIPSYHAVRDESFARELGDRKVPFLTFTNGYELGRNLGYDLPKAA